MSVPRATARFLRRGLRRGHRETSGQATFEFMLMLPLFVLLVLFAVDMAIVGYQYVTVSNAVREGARFAAVNCPPAGDCTGDDVKDLTALRSNGAFDSGDVTVIWEGTDRGDPVMVSAEYGHTLLFFDLGWDFPIASCAVMRLEQSDSLATSGGTAEC